MVRTLADEGEFIGSERYRNMCRAQSVRSPLQGTSDEVVTRELCTAIVCAMLIAWYVEAEENGVLVQT